MLARRLCYIFFCLSKKSLRLDWILLLCLGKGQDSSQQVFASQFNKTHSNVQNKLSWKKELINHWGGSMMMKKITETSRADLNSGFQKCDHQRDCELSGNASQFLVSPNDLRESGQRLSSCGTIHNLNAVIFLPPTVCMCACRGHSQHFLTSWPFPDM